MLTWDPMNPALAEPEEPIAGMVRVLDDGDHAPGRARSFADREEFHLLILPFQFAHADLPYPVLSA
jgi:hypothetical protein